MSKFFILIIMIIAAIAGFFVLEESKEAEPLSLPPSAAIPQGSTSTPEVKPLPPQGLTSAVEIPDLDRQIPGDADEEIARQIKEVSQLLKDNYDYLQAWIQLGLLRKAIGDYQGTRQAWEFAALIRPDTSLPFSNLGALYGYYLKDYKKAEENFLKAIAKEPENAELYQQTADFYREKMKDEGKAEEILEKIK